MSPKHNKHRGQLCMEPNSFVTGSGASFPFLWFFFFPLLFILYDSVTLFLISWITEILPSGPFSHHETHIPTEALAPVSNHYSGSKEETRKKKQREEEDYAVFLEERRSGCGTQQLEAFAVMVKEGFAVKVVRNWKDILVDTLFKGPNFHILSGNMIQNVFSTYKYFKLGEENKNVLIFGICLEDKIKFVKY